MASAAEAPQARGAALPGGGRVAHPYRSSSRGQSTGASTPPASSSSSWARRGRRSLLCAATYAVRVFGITGGYHRYFAHKSYRTSRAFQFLLARRSAARRPRRGRSGGPAPTGATTATPTRRATPTRPREGFWYAHQGWIFDSHWGGTPTELIRDFARYPELALAEPVARAAAPRPRGAVLGDRRLRRPRVGLLGLDGAALARDLLGELGGAHLGLPPLRDRRHQPQQPADRAAHLRRGLAQQPPPLPGVGAQRLPLVGARRHLLRPARPRRGRD